MRDSTPSRASSNFRKIRGTTKEELQSRVDEVTRRLEMMPRSGKNVPLTARQFAEAMTLFNDPSRQQHQNQLPESVPKEFTDTIQFEQLLGQLIARLRAADANWKLGQPYVFPPGMGKAQKGGLFTWYRHSISTTLRLPCDLCQASIPRGDYHKTNRHECAKLAEYMKYIELVFPGGRANPAGVRAPTISERKSVKE